MALAAIRSSSDDAAGPAPMIATSAVLTPSPGRARQLASNPIAELFSRLYQRSPASWVDAYGTDRVEALTRLCNDVRREYPNSVFFAARLLFEREHWWNRWLHNQTVRDMERLLHDRGSELIVVPVRL